MGSWGKKKEEFFRENIYNSAEVVTVLWALVQHGTSNQARNGGEFFIVMATGKQFFHGCLGGRFWVVTMRHLGRKEVTDAKASELGTVPLQINDFQCNSFDIFDFNCQSDRGQIVYLLSRGV